MERRLSLVSTTLVGIGAGLALWLAEFLVLFLKKLFQPTFWFYLPLKMLAAYVLIGAVAGILAWLAAVILDRKRARGAADFRLLIMTGFLIIFGLPYLGLFYLDSIRPSIPLREGIWRNDAVAVAALIIWGALVRRTARLLVTRGRVVRTGFIVLAAAGLTVAAWQLAFDLNSLVFPRAEAAKKREAGQPNLLVILVDALRADHLSCLGYDRIQTSSIDRLAREGVIFTQCISQASWTLPSLGSLLTSKYPSQHGAETQTDKRNPLNVIRNIFEWGWLRYFNVTLPEVLKRADFYTVGLQPNITAGSLAGFDQGYDFHLDAFKYYTLVLETGLEAVLPDSSWRKIYPSFRYAPAESVVNYASRWLERNSEQRFGLLALLFDTHEYYLKRGEFADLHRLKKETAQADLIDLYDRAIVEMDRTIGRLLERMERLGFLDETLVVLLSDHGEEFFDHGGRDRGFDHWYDSGVGHSQTLYDELLRVPLIMRLPAKIKAGLRVEKQVRTIDVMPTILSLLGVEPPGPLEGVDLSANAFAVPDSLPAFSESVLFKPEKKSLRLDGWKLVLHPESGREELYDLRADPGEQTNLAAARPEVLAGLKARLTEWTERMAGEKTQREEGRKVSRRELEALKSLGYIRR
ncbi:MAG: sulfatase-like hydrolase/transferase [Candidatus Aminicenantes bacterium]|nr:sulfatase-like hydrolase/transferase [Candidatus Aminicenantes bacterium]